MTQSPGSASISPSSVFISSDPSLGLRIPVASSTHSGGGDMGSLRHASITTGFLRNFMVFSPVAHRVLVRPDAAVVVKNYPLVHRDKLVHRLKPVGPYLLANFRVMTGQPLRNHIGQGPAHDLSLIH